MFPKILSIQKEWLSLPLAWKGGQFILLKLSWLQESSSLQKGQNESTDALPYIASSFSVELVAYVVKYSFEYPHVEKTQYRHPLSVEKLSSINLGISQEDFQLKVNEAFVFKILDSRVVKCLKTKRINAIYVFQIKASSSHSYYFISQIELSKTGCLQCKKYKIEENFLSNSSVEECWEVVIGDGPLVAFVSRKRFKIFSPQQNDVSSEEETGWILLLEGYMSEIIPGEILSLFPLFIEPGMLCCSFAETSISFGLACCFWSEPMKSLHCMKFPFSSKVLGLCKEWNPYKKSSLYVLTENEIFEWNYFSFNFEKSTYLCDTAAYFKSIGPSELCSVQEGALMTPISYRQKHYLFLFSSGDVLSYIKVVDLSNPFHVVADHKLPECGALYVLYAGEIWMSSDYHGGLYSSSFTLCRIFHCLTENSANNFNKEPVSVDMNRAQGQFLNSLKQRVKKAESWVSQVRANCAKALRCIKCTYYSRVTEGTNRFFDEIPKWMIEFSNLQDFDGLSDFTLSREQSFLESYLSWKRTDYIQERNIHPRYFLRDEVCYQVDQENIAHDSVLSCIAFVRNARSFPFVQFLFSCGILLEIHVEYSSLVTFETIDVLVVLSSDTKNNSNLTNLQARSETQNDFLSHGIHFENSNILLLHLLKPVCNDSSNLSSGTDKNILTVQSSLANCLLMSSPYDFGARRSDIRKWDIGILLDETFVIRCSWEDMKALIHGILATITGLLCVKDDVESSFWLSNMNSVLGLEIFWHHWRQRRIYLTMYCNSREVFESISSKIMACLNCVGHVRVKNILDEKFFDLVDLSVKRLNKEWNYIQNVGLNQVSPQSWFSIVQQTDEQMVLLNTYAKWKLVSFQVSGE
ncbi:hypothetical protein GpartN1_g7190.t1 [Galdieria partita]|uniref:Uncharacterized protein n=1 Tax=Galdieria partita TaxID=83374 RepID=A0A9C7UTL4_9RHOD|nr:hypothetical protein GpartN1_g7190.t1 [Galdieria partita]